MGAAYLRMKGLRLQARLGCFPEEKRRPQTVVLDIALRFAASPKGCVSDRLRDTVDYGALAELVRKAGLTRHFNLIEHLAQTYYDILRAALPPGTDLRVALTKLKVPVRGLAEGVRFELGDGE